MSVIYFDGFGSYPTADIDKRWDVLAGSWSILPTSGRNGSGAIAAAATGARLSRSLNGSRTHLLVGFAFLYTGSVSGTAYFRICQFLAAGNPGLQLGYLHGTGVILSRPGSSDPGNNGHSVVVSVASGDLTASTWYFVELDIQFNLAPAPIDTIGIRVNGGTLNTNASAVSTLTNNSSTHVTDFELGSDDSASGSVGLEYDDLYILDATDGVNSTLLGDVRVETVRPTDNGTSNEFVPTGDTTNAECVDEVDSDGDSTYVLSETAGSRDTYVLGAMESDPAQVFAVQVVAIARKTGTADRTISATIRAGGTNHDSSRSLDLTTDYKCLVEPWDLNPDGDVPWTGGSISAIEAGFLDVP